MPKKKPKLVFEKAYRNIDFLNSPAARNLRILSEMIEPANRLRRHNINNTVVFFGSARLKSAQEAGEHLKALEKKANRLKNVPPKLKKEYQAAKNMLVMSQYYQDAVELSEKLTLWFKEPKNKHKNFKICSGGGPGIMEAANRGAKNVGGESIGLNISLPMEQDPNPYQTADISFEFHYFFIRKFWFFYLAKALIVFPGGFGTLDEFFELVTLVQTNKTKKYMPVVLYGSEYWNDVLNIKAMEKWGMISPDDLKLFRIYDDVDDAFEYLKEELSLHYMK